jgi:hypothetical protein
MVSVLKGVGQLPYLWQPLLVFQSLLPTQLLGLLLAWVYSASKRSALGLAGNIVWAWIFTIPAIALMSMAVYYLNLWIF